VATSGAEHFEHVTHHLHTTAEHFWQVEKQPLQQRCAQPSFAQTKKIFALERQNVQTYSSFELPQLTTPTEAWSLNALWPIKK